MSITAKAYARIPGYDELTQAINLVGEEEKNHLKNHWEGDVTTTQRFVDIALSGGSFPKDILEGTEAKDRWIRNHNLRKATLKNTREELQRRRSAAVRDNSDAALTHLNGVLARIAARGRELADILGTCTDADSVLNAKDDAKTAAWERVVLLVGQYKEVRSVQGAITRECIEQSDAHFLPEVGYYLNSLDTSGFFHRRRSDSYSSAMREDQDEHVRHYNEWLSEFAPARYPFSKSPLPSTNNGEKAFLLYVCKELDPWVPTVRELLTAGQAAFEASMPVDYTRLQGMEDARDEYYEVTRAQPATPYTRSSGPRKKRVKPKRDFRESAINALFG